ncbi:MAG: cysteine hydrolase family protein [Dongiaceae bacterium]
MKRATTGLLIIDLQRGMFSGSEQPYQGEIILDRVAGLLRQARSHGLPVFHVQHDGGPGDVLGKPSAGWEIHPAVRPVAGEPIIEKTVCSAFQGTDLHDRLGAKGIGRLIIAGMQTEYCIDTTCRAAFGFGYQTVLVGDAHTTFDAPGLTAAQIIAHHNRTLKGSFVELTESSAVAF